MSRRIQEHIDSWSSETNLGILQIRELRSRKVKTTCLNSRRSIQISSNKMSRYAALPSAQTPPLPALPCPTLSTLPLLSLRPTPLHSTLSHSFLFPKEVREGVSREHPTSVFLKSLRGKSSSLERLCTPQPSKEAWTAREQTVWKGQRPYG